MKALIGFVVVVAVVGVCSFALIATGHYWVGAGLVTLLLCAVKIG
jgi:hypothetical protein